MMHISRDLEAMCTVWPEKRGVHCAASTTSLPSNFWLIMLSEAQTRGNWTHRAAYDVTEITGEQSM